MATTETNEYGLPLAVRMYHCPNCEYVGTMAQAIYEDDRMCGDCHLVRVASGVRLTKAERDWHSGIFEEFLREASVGNGRLDRPHAD